MAVVIVSQLYLQSLQLRIEINSFDGLMKYIRFVLDINRISNFILHLP